MFLEISEQDGNFGNAGCVLDPVRMNHGEALAPKLEHTNGSLFARHDESTSQARINFDEFALERSINRRFVIQYVIAGTRFHGWRQVLTTCDAEQEPGDQRFSFSRAPEAS